MTSLSQVIPALLRDLGAGALGAYTDVADGPLPVPELVIHHDGPAPTIDCGDLLIVTPTALTSAFQGSVENCAYVLQVGMSVTITRCVPNLQPSGETAENEDLTAAALGLAGDISTLWYGLIGRCRADTLFTSFAGIMCGDVSWHDGRPGVGGGIGWWTLPVTVTVGAPLL
jgi:hypothetical protein